MKNKSESGICTDSGFGFCCYNYVQCALIYVILLLCNQSICFVQPKVSSVLPHWIEVSVS